MATTIAPTSRTRPSLHTAGLATAGSRFPAWVHRACRELDLDAGRSVVIGDKWSDVRLARAAGARGVLIRTGYGGGQEQAPPTDLRPDAVADTLMDAAAWVLRNPPPGGR